MFGPPAEDFVRAVIAAATRHAWRGLINLESIFVEQDRKTGGLQRSVSLKTHLYPNNNHSLLTVKLL